MKRLTWCAGLALLGAALALAAPPPDPTRPDNPPKADNPAKTDATPMNVSDADFVQLSTSAQLAEINLGRLAVMQASDPQVKQFGQTMVDDHGKALEEEDRAADKAGLKPAQAMSDKDQAAYKKLAGLKGADFDKEYVPAQVAAHKEAVALFEAESKNGKNDDLKAFASKALPTLQHHLEMAQKLPVADTGTTPTKTGTDKDKPVKDKDQ